MNSPEAQPPRPDMVEKPQELAERLLATEPRLVVLGKSVQSAPNVSEKVKYNFVDIRYKRWNIWMPEQKRLIGFCANDHSRFEAQYLIKDETLIPLGTTAAEEPSPVKNYFVAFSKFQTEPASHFFLTEEDHLKGTPEKMIDVDPVWPRLADVDRSVQYKVGGMVNRIWHPGSFDDHRQSEFEDLLSQVETQISGEQPSG